MDALPDDAAPSYLFRDRDSVYGHVFRQRVKGMGVGEVLTAPHSLWQNPFAERLIGSIRRECLNHVVVLGKRHLRRTLARYFAYYHRARTHLSLDNDAPHGRPIERPELGKVIPIREVGGPAPSLRRAGNLIQLHRFARVGPVVPSACSPPTQVRVVQQWSDGPAGRPDRPQTPASLGLSARVG